MFGSSPKNTLRYPQQTMAGACPRRSASCGIGIRAVSVLPRSRDPMACNPPLGHLAVACGRPSGGLVHYLIGKPVNAGNNLLIDEIHDPKKTVPLRMVPLVLASTVISHFWNYRAVSSNRFCHFTIALQAPLSCINQRFQGASGFLTKREWWHVDSPLRGRL